MPENSPITAARFSITVDGYEIASFSELQGVRTEIKTVEFIESGEKGLVQMNIPSNPVLATIILKRAQTQEAMKSAAPNLPAQGYGLGCGGRS